MFIDIPEQFVVSTKNTTTFTSEAFQSPDHELTSVEEVKDWMSRRSHSIREQVLDFGHGQFTLRQHSGDLALS